MPSRLLRASLASLLDACWPRGTESSHSPSRRGDETQTRPGRMTGTTNWSTTANLVGRAHSRELKICTRRLNEPEVEARELRDSRVMRVAACPPHSRLLRSYTMLF